MSAQRRGARPAFVLSAWFHTAPRYVDAAATEPTAVQQSQDPGTRRVLLPLARQRGATQRNTPCPSVDPAPGPPPSGVADYTGLVAVAESFKGVEVIAIPTHQTVFATKSSV